MVSNCGRVKSKERPARYVHAVTGDEHFRNMPEKLMKIFFNNLTGYKFVSLRKEKKAKSRPIHSLVAETFLERLPHHECVNHKDGNKHNNRVDNLEWCTNAYNHEHATQTGLVASGERVANSKLNDKCIIAIRKLVEKGWSDKQIAQLFEVQRTTILHVRHGKTWSKIALTGQELQYNP